jgi:hypothetical protein
MRTRALLAVMISLLAGCSGGGGSKGGAGGAGSGGGTAGGAGATTGGAGAGGSAGPAGAGGQNAGGAGAQGAAGATGGNAGGVAGASAGSGGATGGASGTTGAGAAAGTSGGAGAGGGAGGVVVTGTGGGTFVMCDDHADFNGRGLCAPTGKFGAVVAKQTLTAGGAVTTLTASFAAAKPTTDPGCTQEAVGTACVAVTCPSGAPKNPAGPEAGAITAKSNGGSILTKPDAMGAYDVAGFPSALWSQAKAALTFAAAGGAVPMFSETFCGPPSATITTPAAAPGAGLTIDRASDLAVQWTGGAVGDLELVARDLGAGGASVEVRCFFTGSAGQGTVPKAALAKMSAGPHTVASYIWVRKISLPQGTCVELTGVNTNVGAGNAPWNGSAIFQ